MAGLGVGRGRDAGGDRRDESEDSERISFRGRVWVDSSAALGVVSRKGNGKLRHVRVGQLWVQEQAANGEIAYRKVCGKVNPADLLTKHLAQDDMWKHVKCRSLERREGRASSAPATLST